MHRPNSLYKRYIQSMTYATSLNDTFWVKSEEEDINWEQVSLYQNKFDEVISRISFEVNRLYGMQFSATTPEFSGILVKSKMYTVD